MTAIINARVVAITRRMGRDPRTGQPAPYSEIFYEFERDGSHLRALTRVPWEVSDTPHGRACERAAFLRRQERAT